MDNAIHNNQISPGFFMHLSFSFCDFFFVSFPKMNTTIEYREVSMGRIGLRWHIVPTDPNAQKNIPFEFGIVVSLKMRRWGHVAI